MGNLERIQTATSRYEASLRNVLGVDTGHAQTSFVGSFSTGTGIGVGAQVKMPFMPFGGRLSTESGKALVAFRDPNKCVTVSLKDETYDKIIVQVDDKEHTATEIRKAVPKFV